MMLRRITDTGRSDRVRLPSGISPYGSVSDSTNSEQERTLMIRTSQKAAPQEARSDVSQCLEHVTAHAIFARLITLLAGASLVLFLASALLPASASQVNNWYRQPYNPRSRTAAIVDGHHVQPRRGDASTPATDEVQQLYRDLMDLTAPDRPRDLDGMPLALPAAPDANDRGN
jgi:hypothetical protein